MEDLTTPVNITLSADHMIEEWSRYTVMRLKESLYDKIGSTATGSLMRSIEDQLVKHNGNIDQVLTKFLKYGRFVDMGVGRGVPIGAAGTSAFSAARNSNGTLRAYRRKPKKWFSRKYYSEVQRFREIYTEMFKKEIPLQICDALNASINLSA